MSTHEHVFITDHSQMLEASQCPSTWRIYPGYYYFFMEEEGNSDTWYKTDEPCGHPPEQSF